MLRQPGKPYPDSVKEKARELRRQGHSLSEISRRLGVGAESAGIWCAGIPAPRQGESWQHYEQVRQGWIDGLSAGAIARPLPITRSAVIGVIKRARDRGEAWARLRPEPVKIVRKRPKRAHKPAPAPPIAAAPTPRAPAKAERPAKRIVDMKATVPDTLNVALVDLGPNQCKAVTDPTRWAQRFCGHPIKEGSVYCEGHHVLHHEGGRQQKQKAAQR